jgi:hypothetical protein
VCEAVSPGFDYEDMELGSLERIAEIFPELQEQLREFVMKEN